MDNLQPQPYFARPHHQQQQPQQNNVSVFLNERELLQQYEANLKVKEGSLNTKQEALSSQQEQLESERRILAFQKEQYEIMMKQREEQFEIMMKQREMEFSAREELVIPGPSSVLLPVVGSEPHQYEPTNQPLLPEYQGLLKRLTSRDNNDNIILGKQLKQVAASVQNKYDDALRLVDQATKLDLQLKTQQKELEMKRQNDQKELEMKRLEIETTRLNIPADMDLEQLRDKLVACLPSSTGASEASRIIRDTVLYITTKLSDDDFTLLKPYLPHLLKCHLTPDQIDHIIVESRLDNNNEHVMHKAQVLELYSTNHSNDGNYTTMVNTIVHQNKKDLESSQLYRNARQHLFTTNFKQWGSSKDKLKIEFKLIPIGFNYHSYQPPYCSLLGVLYSLTGVTSTRPGSTTHTHPTDPSISSSCSAGLFNYYYNPLLTNGTIPQLSSNPRLYFSTPHIANGDWIQFHGPGPTIFDIKGSDGSKFHLTLGGLCPKGKEGSYTSEGKFYYFDETRLSSDQYTSHYQISIKWD